MHVVTGKLGGGKSLYCVKKASDYLWEGRRVVTNLDLNLSNLMGKRSKCKTLERLPDQPSHEDLINIGRGYEGKYNEDKTGALILDECATWLNARDWNQKGRKELLDVLVHIRKLGWDCYFIIQDVTMLDKQLRRILAEHVVIVRRLDRVSIPFISSIARLGGIESVLPKAHMAQTFYGDHQGASAIKLETFLGKKFYSAYDTTQIFNDQFDSYYCIVPPKIQNSLKNVKWSFKKLMQLSKVYWKSLSRPLVFVFAIILTSISVTYYFEASNQDLIKQVEELKKTLLEELPPTASGESLEVVPGEEPDTGIAARFRIDGFMIVGELTIYSLRDRKDLDFELSTQELASLGYSIRPRGACEALLVNKATGDVQTLTCL